MIEVDEAKRLLATEVRVLGTEELDLALTSGRVLAEEVVADRDFPVTDRSAMDGFAVRAEDAAWPGGILTVAGEIRAGQPVGAIRVGPREAIRIFTGAIVPPGADTVVMVELTEEDRSARRVRILERPRAGQNVRLLGEDVRCGARILEPGRPIHAAEMAALTAVGKKRVRVFRTPVVRILSTGDEVVEVDCLPKAHQVRNSNARGLLAQLLELGLEGAYLGVAADTAEDIDRALKAAISAEVLLITGGVSVGEYDLVGPALRRAGIRMLFQNVAMRPGKPILVGRCGGCIVAGLPGNPVSTFTGFAVLLAPMLRRMMGYVHHENPEIQVTLSERLHRKPGRTTYHLGRVEVEGGRLTARPVRTTSSGDVVSMSRANAFLVTPGGAHAVEAGTLVSSLLWRDFYLR